MRTRLVLLWCAAAMLATGLLSSCSDDSVSPSGPSGPSWVAWRNPNVFYCSYELRAIWGSSSRNVYAVGGQGVVIRFDGAEWTVMHGDGKAGLNAVWGSPSGDVFVVGEGGTVLHHDGRFWRSMSSGTSAELRGVWGGASNDVYAVGEAGTVLHFDGREWRSISTGTDRTLNGVWGDDYRVFAVGDGGTVLRLTPREARRMDVPATNNLYNIGGTSATGLYAVGDAGSVFRFDGSSWQAVRIGLLCDLETVCGTRDGHLIITSGSRILDFDGREWKFMDVAPEGYSGFVDVWGLSMSSLFLLEGDKVLRYDGSTPSAMELPVPPSGDAPGQTLVDMWGSSEIDVYAAGAGGTVFHYDGTGWTSAATGAPELHAIWGISESEIYAVCTTYDEEGDMCIDLPPRISWILSFDGTTWSSMNPLEGKAIESIWGDSGGRLFAVGSVWECVEDGRRSYFRPYRIILRYDGATWTTMVEGTTEGVFYAIWGSSGNDVFAVGSGGAILHYDGSSWTEMTSGTSETLYTVWGNSANDVFAVGSGGVIQHFDGQSWVPMASGTTITILGVWGNSMDDVFAVGEGGTILHFDGSTWGLMMSPTEKTLHAVWGAAPDDVFAVGEYGTICHYGAH